MLPQTSQKIARQRVKEQDGEKRKYRQERDEKEKLTRSANPSSLITLATTISSSSRERVYRDGSESPDEEL